VEREELLDDSGEVPYGPGDRLTLYVVDVTESEIRLSRALSGVGGLNMLAEAHAGGLPVEGRVVETCKGGFRVEMLHHKAFCPISQMDLRYVENPEPFVGQTFAFRITRFEENGRNIVVSRRRILEEEQRRARTAFLEELAPGAVLAGTVSRVMPYGAFVEIGPGIEGLVHVSELSWSRLAEASEGVAPGDRLTVKVMEIRPDENKGMLRISLSVKQVQADPWLEAGDKYHPGDTLEGRVTRCAKFGAFVEIAPGIEGLVHISEMTYLQRVHRPEDLVKPGDEVKVVVQSLDLPARRISLSMRAAEGDPWVDVEEQFRPGQAVTGTVEKKEDFGIFVRLAPGVTGLLPKSRIVKSQAPTRIEGLRPGSPVPVTVTAVDVRARKISLDPGHAAGEKDWQKFSSAPSGSLGDLGEKLRQALEAGKKH
jgi:small subunit ribosomal protein S1